MSTPKSSAVRAIQIKELRARLNALPVYGYTFPSLPEPWNVKQARKLVKAYEAKKSRLMAAQTQKRKARRQTIDNLILSGGDFEKAAKAIEAFAADLEKEKAALKRKAK